MAGDFYTGTEFPESYRGSLFYADFVQGWMRYADVSDRANVQSADFAIEVPPLTQITNGADGALYYASIGTNDIRRIRYAGSVGGGTGGDTGGDTGGSTGGTTSDSGVQTDGDATDGPLVSTGGGGLGFGWLAIVAGLIGSRRQMARYRRV